MQTILDASFLALLAYPPAHPVLRDIGAVVQPELEFTDEVEQLRGPLEPFVRAHDRMVREAANGEEKPDPDSGLAKKAEGGARPGGDCGGCVSGRGAYDLVLYLPCSCAH